MKKILLCILFVTIFVVISNCIELGIGYTADIGLHFSVNRIELQGLFDKDFSVLGLRWYPVFKSIKVIREDLSLYVGGEFNYVISDLLDWGYSFGIFSGLQKNLYKSLYLGIDLGVFLCTLKGWEEFTDWGLAINTKLTYKFKI